MTTPDLAEMRMIVRRMSARWSPQQMTDAQIDRKINLFLTKQLPLHFKNIKLTKPYVFTTIPNVDTYDFVYENDLVTTPNGNPVPGNIELTGPVFCQGYPVRFMQDKSIFYNRWPALSVNQQINQGDDTSGPYQGTIPSTPFLRAQMDIFGNVTESQVIISAYDDTGFTYVLRDQAVDGSNVGNLIDEDGVIVGTVDYLSGDYDFTVANSDVIPAGAIIYAAVVPYQPSRPLDALFYNQQIVLRPVPRQIYQMEFQISQQPIDLIADGSFPELSEWYLFICMGATKLIYAEFPDEMGEADLEPKWQEQLCLAQRRTLRQLGTQRSATIFSTPGRPLAGVYYGNEYSGTS